MLIYLPPNLAAMAKLTAAGNARYAVNSLRVLDPGDGTYRVEATDGRRLAVVRGPSADAHYSALEEAPGGAGEVLVPGPEWAQAFRAGDKKHPVGLAAGQGLFTFAAGGHSFTGTPQPGRYPDTGGVLPGHPALVHFCVDPVLFAGLCDLAAALGLRDSGGVQVLYFGPGKPVGLIGRNDQGQYLDCLIMPLG